MSGAHRSERVARQWWTCVARDSEGRVLGTYGRSHDKALVERFAEALPRTPGLEGQTFEVARWHTTGETKGLVGREPTIARVDGDTLKLGDRAIDLSRLSVGDREQFEDLWAKLNESRDEADGQMPAKLRITLARSVIGHPQDQKDTARALGLTKLNRTVVRPDSAAVRGMVAKLHHLVRMEEIGDGEDGE